MANEYLNELEQQAIVRFNSDTIMSNAVKKVLLDVIYNQGILSKGEKPNVLKNFALMKVSQREVNNEELGADLRAIWEGCNLLENGFNQLAQIKMPEQPDPAENPNPAK